MRIFLFSIELKFVFYGHSLSVRMIIFLKPLQDALSEVGEGGSACTGRHLQEAAQPLH